MRSGSFAWLLETSGYKVFLLEGGYKSYRNFAIEQSSRSLKLTVLSGKTGTGKTLLLHEYSKQGKQVIDLEGLACHKGSVFGGIGQQHAISDSNNGIHQNPLPTTAPIPDSTPTIPPEQTGGKKQKRK